jgi:hypothetical protein
MGGNHKDTHGNKIYHELPTAYMHIIIDKT